MLFGFSDSHGPQDNVWASRGGAEVELAAVEGQGKRGKDLCRVRGLL